MNKRIIAQNGNKEQFFGEIGKVTPFVDVHDDPLHIGDVVMYYPFEYKKDKVVTDVICGITFLMEEDTSKSCLTGENRQYIMGIANCKPLYNEDGECYAWGENKEDHDDNLWWVKKVKSYNDLVSGEKIGNFVVTEID